MKFMKLGSKLDTFQTEENNVRVVTTGNASDFTVNFGGVKFYVHRSCTPTVLRFTFQTSLVVAVRCAAGYLEMYQTIDTGNLISKIDTFPDTSIFCSWKDSIIALQTTKTLLPCSKDLKLITRCIDSIASKASIDPSKVDWSYAYDRNKLQSENGFDQRHVSEGAPRDEQE